MGRIIQLQNYNYTVITREALLHVDPEELFRTLISSKGPLMEAQLLREVFSLTTVPSSTRELYVLHFSLYHALYQLKKSAICKNYSITIDTMNISLKSILRNGMCSFFDHTKNHYCDRPAVKDRFCLHHACEHRDVFFDPMRTFYEDEDNILFGNSSLIEKGLASVFLYAARKEDVAAAMKLFGITEKSMSSLKTKYRAVAKQFHPDTSQKDESMMKRINYYYSLLKEIYQI